MKDIQLLSQLQALIFKLNNLRHELKRCKHVIFLETLTELKRRGKVVLSVPVIKRKSR